MNKILLILLVILIQASLTNQKSCKSLIYCQGSLLHTVQQARIFDDSKTFVDMALRHPVDRTLDSYYAFMLKNHGKPTRDQIKQFVIDHFEISHEYDVWHPSDFNQNPKFLRLIRNVEMREFAKNLINIWPSLAKRVRPDVFHKPDHYSLIPMPHGFIIPGGRFREFYYWDTYWIIKGLLISEMRHTVRGILDNFMSLVARYGFISNGGRIYYLDRSQPPLLTLMVNIYIEEGTKNDMIWLTNNIQYLDQELQYFLDERTVEVFKDNHSFIMARYNSNSGTPRSESYIEDIRTASCFDNIQDKMQCYSDIKNAAESGWDFSSRWLFDSNGGNELASNLSHIQTHRVIPVDLNTILCKSFYILKGFYAKLKNKNKTVYWGDKAKLFQTNIQQVLYDKEDGIWYDYDLELKRPRRYYYASNLAPLWTETYDTRLRDEYGQKAVDYLQKSGIMTCSGGIPTSMIQSGEQCDFPNAWAPIQSMIIMGLEQTGNVKARRVAKEFADRWLETNMRAYEETGELFEKYDAVALGGFGSGGEYRVQVGFGWTIGVALELIDYYYNNALEQC